MGNAARIPKLSAADYLTWEVKQSERNIFVRGEVFAMSGGTAEHNEATIDAAIALKRHLKGTSCKVFATDMRLRVETADCYYYPDVFGTCSATDINNPKLTTLTGAKLIIEVLSPSTAAFDRGDKFADYRTLDTLEEYVLIDPDGRSIDVFRKGTDGLWVLHPSNTVSPTVRFESVGWVGEIGDLLNAA